MTDKYKLYIFRLCNAISESCTTWWFNICRHCETVAIIKLINTSIPSHSFHLLCVCVVRTLKIYSLSRFQVFSLEERIAQSRKPSFLRKNWAFVQRCWLPVGFFFLFKKLPLHFISYWKSFLLLAWLPSLSLRASSALSGLPCWPVSPVRLGWLFLLLFIVWGLLER